MILRRLHQADLGIGEHRHQILEPVRLHDIVGVETPMISASGAVCASASRSAPALKPCEIVVAHELEALAERAAMLLDRPPERRIGRVVDDDDAFEIRIVEPRDRIERLLEHLRRLAIGRDMDRDFRRDGASGASGGACDQPARLAAEGDRGDLLDARQRDEDQRDQQHERRAPSAKAAPGTK